MAVREAETLDERLDRLELAHNQTQRTLARVVALMDGDPSYRITGIPDQLAAYIKANEDWKRATESRITENDSRLRTLESRKQIMISPAAAILLVVIGTACLIAAYYVLTWLQSAGEKNAWSDISSMLFLGIYRSTY